MSLSAFDQWARIVLEGIYTVVWQSSLLIVLAWVVLSVCGKASPRWKHLMWMVVVVRLLLPPLFSLPTSFGNWGPDLWEQATLVEESPLVMEKRIFQEGSSPSSVQFVSGRVMVVPSFEGEVINPVEVREEPRVGGFVFPVYALLFLCWIGGVVGVLALSLWQIRRFASLADPLPEEYSWAEELMERAAHQLNYKGRVNVRYLLGNQSPVVTGLTSPKIILSSDLFDCLSWEEIYSVLLHEIAHLKRRDHWFVVLQVIAKALHFYNPLVWLFMASMDKERECDCDDLVTNTEGVDRGIYANSLNMILTNLLQPPRLTPGLLGMAEIKSEVGKRIVRILKRNSPQKRRLGPLSLMVIVMFALVFTSFYPVVSAQNTGDIDSKESNPGMVIEEEAPLSVEEEEFVALPKLQVVADQSEVEEVVDGEDEEGYVFTDKQITDDLPTGETIYKPTLEMGPPENLLIKRYMVPDYLVDLISRDVNEALLSQGSNLQKTGQYGIGLEFKNGVWFITVQGEPEIVSMVGALVSALIDRCQWMNPDNRFDLRGADLYEMKDGMWWKRQTVGLSRDYTYDRGLSLKRVLLREETNEGPIYDIHFSYRFTLADYQYLPREQWDNKDAFDLNFQVMIEGMKAFLPGYNYILVHQQAARADVNDSIEVVTDEASLEGLKDFLWKWSKAPLFEKNPQIYLYSSVEQTDLADYLRSRLPNNRYRVAGRLDPSVVVVACLPQEVEKAEKIAHKFDEQVRIEELVDFTSKEKRRFESSVPVLIQHGFAESIAWNLRKEFDGRDLVVGEVPGKDLIFLQGSKEEVRFAQDRISDLDIEMTGLSISCVYIEFPSAESMDIMDGLVNIDNVGEMEKAIAKLEELGVDFSVIFSARDIPFGYESNFHWSRGRGLSGEEETGCSHEEKFHFRVIPDEDNPNSVCLSPLTYQIKSIVESENVHKSWTVRMMRDKPHLLYIDSLDGLITPETPKRALMVKISEVSD